MRKINSFMTVLCLTATGSALLSAPLISCNNSQHYPSFPSKDANLDITMPNIELNKQLIVVCTPKTGYDVDLESIIVEVKDAILTQGTDYEVKSTNNVGCTITIHADKVTSYDIKITVKSKVEKPTVTSLEVKPVEESFEEFEKGSYITAENIVVTAHYSDGTSATLECEQLDGYYIYVEDKEQTIGYREVENFASTGYTFTLEDQKNGSKDLWAVYFYKDETYKSAKFTIQGKDIASTLEVKCNIEKFEKGTTIKASDLVVTANHTHSDPVVLESDKDDGYYVYHKVGTEYILIDDFKNTGYTFTLDDQKAETKKLWAVHVITSASDYINKSFEIAAWEMPVYKNLTATSNLTIATVGDKITPDNLTVTANYFYKQQETHEQKSWGTNGYQVYSKGEAEPIADFGTNGYTFTAEDLALGKKEFTISYTEGSVTKTVDITVNMIAAYTMSYDSSWYGYKTDSSLNVAKGNYLFKIVYDGTNNFQNFGLTTSASYTSYIDWIDKCEYKVYYTAAGSTDKEDVTSGCYTDPDLPKRIILASKSGATTGCIYTITLNVKEDLGENLYPFARKNG